MSPRAFQLLYSLIVTSIVTLLFLNIAFLGYGLGILRNEFADVYFKILLAGAIVLWLFLIIDFTKLIPRNSPISFGFIYEDNPSRLYGMAIPIARVIPHLFLAGLFVLSAIGLKSAIVPVPEAFKLDTLSQVDDATKIFYQSVVPGFGEEAVIFGIVCTVTALVYILLSNILKLRFNKKIMAFLSQIIGCGVGSYIFMLGHNMAYGLSESAKISAFIFEFIVQMANQMTGMLLSWLPHMIHNYVVMAFAFTIILSIGAESFIIAPITRWRKHGQYN